MVFTDPCQIRSELLINIIGNQYNKGVNIILDTTIYWTFHRSEHQGMAKKTFKFAAAT
jgi:hypothetical protein